VAATAAVAAAVIIIRRRRARTPQDPRTEWTCECSQEYLVQGTGRHRVYWVAGADYADPLLGRECVRCGTPLLQSSSSGNTSQSRSSAATS